MSSKPNIPNATALRQANKPSTFSSFSELKESMLNQPKRKIETTSMAIALHGATIAVHVSSWHQSDDHFVRVTVPIAHCDYALEPGKCAALRQSLLTPPIAASLPGGSLPFTRRVIEVTTMTMPFRTAARLRTFIGVLSSLSPTGWLLQAHKNPQSFDRVLKAWSDVISSPKAELAISSLLPLLPFDHPLLMCPLTRSAMSDRDFALCMSGANHSLSSSFLSRWENYLNHIKDAHN